MLEHMTGKKNLLIAGVIVFFMIAMTLGGSSIYGQEEPPLTLDESTQLDEMQIEKKDYVEHEALVMFKTASKLSGKQGRNRTMSLFRTDVSDITVDGIWTFSDPGEMTKSRSGAKKLVKDSTASGYNGVALVRSNSLTTKQLIRILNKRDDVKYAEPNYRVYARDNGDYSRFQWNMRDSGEKDGTGTTLSTPNVNFEWKVKQTTGSDKIVAVLDTGVDYTHPDIQDNMWENYHYPTLKGEFGYDFVNGDNDPMDDSGHGTHVAGIIGASGENGNNVGTVGVNQKIRIMALKVLDDDGAADLAHEIEAYNYIDIALDKGEPIVAINNSWGGGDYSEIFAELIDIVGEKGAVSVCAAGNAAADNDLEEDFPSCIDSPYVISVAATDRDGELAEYSNYGLESVDVAAPGSEILSTVSYDSYNPTIYDEDKRDRISKEFNDFEGEDNDGNDNDGDDAEPAPWGEQTIDPETGTVYLNGERYDPEKDKPGIDIENSSDIGGFESKKSMYVNITDLAAGDLVCLTVPYDISLEAETMPSVSMMAKATSLKPTFDGMGGSILAVTDMERDGGKDLDSIVESTIVGKYIDGPTKLWDHLELELPADDDLDALIKKAKRAGQEEPLQRDLVILVYAYAAGDYEVQIDDLGLSDEVEVKDTSEFERYDYMTGTSMSTPFISGAIALKAQELYPNKPNREVEPETLINRTISLVKDGQLKPEDRPIVMKNSFEFREEPSELPARIGGIKVDLIRGNIVIKGSGLNTATKVEIGDDENDDESMKDVTKKAIITEKEITIPNDGWINNIKTVRLTSNDRNYVRRDVYMVNGKRKYTKLNEMFEDTDSGNMTTDGANVYWTNSSDGTINYIPISSAYPYPSQLCGVDPDEIFKGTATRNTGDYGMLFGEDLVYTNGSLYNVVEYGLMQSPEDSELDGIFFSGSNGKSNEGYSFMEKTVSGEGNSTIYSGHMRLIATRQDEYGETEVINLGDIPDDLKSTVDWTMAAYNGKIYFMGGYSYKKDNNTGKRVGITKSVWIYDPASWAWYRGPDLPEARAGGKAIQSGDKLVYALGYSKDQEGKSPEEQNYPKTMILKDNNLTDASWDNAEIVGEVLSPHIIDGVVTRGKNKYVVSDGNIGAVKGGVAFMGDPVVNYGDTLFYVFNEKSYRDTGYNFINRLDSDEMNGVVTGGRLYGFENDRGYFINVPSDLVNVTARKTKGKGSVAGGGTFLPGNTANVIIKAAKNWKIKSIKDGRKTIKLNKKVTTKQVVTFAGSNLTSDHNVTAQFVKYKAKVKVKKKGKGKVTGGKTYVIGKKATIKVKAKKGYYIKSIKQGKKTIKVKKKATSKTFKFKVKKDITVKVVFAKKK